MRVKRSVKPRPTRHRRQRLAAAGQSEERIFNIGSGQGRDLRQVIVEVEANLGVQLAVRRTKGRLIDVPASILAIATARDALGWRPCTPFDVGIKQTIAWWRARAI